MTPNLLLIAIKTFLDAELAGDITIPAIHLYDLPAKTKGNQAADDPPYIVMRATSGTDEGDSSMVKVVLVFGVKDNEDGKGIMTLSNLMEKVRISLLRTRLLESRFALQEPYQWEIFDEQPQPIYEGIATTTWMLPTIRQEVPYL
ncbi:hypothetical protein [Paenibacillus sp. P22]|uniref:hypothetical protein n=1 Tax=Paenibacillus sp. P22 TaxID=483908 RepID=UPI00043438C9|nr:hypothetical protein [Paenibacillus sp. P22]CDN41456.1 Putative uncharacterized protein [Paenibacillus sp. P22]